jgi:hypothetical protein
MTFLL